MVMTFRVLVSADDLPFGIDPGSLRLHGTRVINWGEFAALQEESVNNIIASVPAHDVAVVIDAVGARIGRAGKVESGKRTAAKEEAVPWSSADTIVAHDVS